MSEPATPARPFYVTGGTLKPGEPSYVERRADADLFDSILAGEFCYVLTARQMGKSSLMARTATRLEQAGVASAIVDLTQIGSERGAQGAAQWYFGIANKIHQQLKVDAPLRSWWQERADLSSVQRLTDFFRELVLTHCPGRVVIFVDEIDSTIGLLFADDFFAALRACFNARATEPVFERLTFVLLGVATPNQLIQDPTRTPFNIGKRIDLTDFSPDEARTLAPGLHADPGEAERRLERILHWTGGHPYLSQALCRAVREKGAIETAEKVVDPQVEELFLSSRAQREETNLKHVRARLEKPGPEGRRLLQLYRRVRQGKPVPDQPTSPLFAQLKLAGVVEATDEGRLAVRNRIYEAVFTPAWARSAMPPDRGRQFMAFTLTALLMGILVWAKLQPPPPDEVSFRAAIEDDAYNSARVAYTALYANPSTRYRATELMQQFWEQRGLRYALAGKRDESLLSYLQGLSLKDSKSLRRQAGNLVSWDYGRLRLTLRHKNAVGAIAFSPNGRALAIGSGSAVFLRDAITGKLLAHFSQQGQAVRTVIFRYDGRVLAGFHDGKVCLWDTATGKVLTHLWQQKSDIEAIAFSSNGQILATTSKDRPGVGLWDAFTGKPLLHPLQPDIFPLGLPAMAFSPNGQALAIGSPDGTMNLWDVVTGEPLARPWQSEDIEIFASVFAIAFSPDGQTLATASGHGAIHLWDTATHQFFAHPLQHQDVVYAVVFSPDGRALATGSADHTVRLWDAVTGDSLAQPLQSDVTFSAVAFNSDGQTLATGSQDGTVRLWDGVAGKPLAHSYQDEARIVVAVISPNGRTLATGTWDGTVRLRDSITGKPLSPPLKHNFRKPVTAMAFSRDGRTLVTGSEDRTVRLWDSVTGKLLAQPLQYEKAVYAVTFSPDGRILATGSYNDTVRLWNGVTGTLLIHPLQHENLGSSVYAIAFSPDGRTLATGSSGNTAQLWDAVTGKPLVSLQHEDAVISLAFSPDGRTVLTGSADKTVQLWDAHNGKLLTSSLRIQDFPQTIAFSPDGKAFFVATDHWLNTYSWDGKKAVPLSSQLLHGFWKKGFRFPPDCERCLQVALGDTGNSFHLETLHLDEPADPPIEGDPKKLLEKWKGRLGLKFDEQMRPVPAVDFSGGPAEALGGGRRSPGARPR